MRASPSTRPPYAPAPRALRNAPSLRACHRTRRARLDGCLRASMMAKCLVCIAVMLLTCGDAGHHSIDKRCGAFRRAEGPVGNKSAASGNQCGQRRSGGDPIVLTPPGAHVGFSTFSDAFNRDDGDGIMVSLQLGPTNDRGHNTCAPRFHASATILRADASWQLYARTLDDAYFGYVWHPLDNRKAVDCCYYRDGASNQRINAAGQLYRCGAADAKAANATSAKAAIRVPPIICSGTGAGEDCIKRMLSEAKAHGCPQCDVPIIQSENEVVVLRHHPRGPVKDGLASLSARNKPWPTALVLAYRTQGALNTTQAVYAQLLSTGMLRRHQETFVNETLVLVMELPCTVHGRSVRDSGSRGTGAGLGLSVGPAVSMLKGLVRLGELAAFLDEAPRRPDLRHRHHQPSAKVQPRSGRGQTPPPP